VNRAGHPVELRLSAGQEQDLTYAESLLADHRPGAVIADKGYDSDAFVAAVRRRKARVVIPPLSCRKVQRRYDKALYRVRNIGERFWSRVKQYRRVATRYDKTARNFLAFIHLASALVAVG
jgi:transposase